MAETNAKSSPQSISGSFPWASKTRRPKSDITWRTISTTRTFMSARELTIAIKDAIRGHEFTSEMASEYPLYRNVGNPPLLAKTGDVMLSGFLHNFPYISMDAESKAVSVDDAPETMSSNGEHNVADGVCSTTESATKGQDNRRTERTGIYYFTACEILSGRVVQRSHHDLESAYWVLLWTLLRHGNYVHPKYTLEDFRNTFTFGDDHQSKNNKKGWLVDYSPGLSFPSCAPLTKLLLDFSDLVFRSVGVQRIFPPVPISYGEVLAIFDGALAKDGWPTEDCSLSCIWRDDKTPRGAEWGLVSDFHGLDSTTPPDEVDGLPTRSRTQRNEAAGMPPHAKLCSGTSTTSRSAQKRCRTMIEVERHGPEGSPWTHTGSSHSSSKRPLKRPKIASTSALHAFD